MRHAVVVLSAVALLSTAADALAQQGTGQLRGRVVDSQGAILPGVVVVARNEDSGVFREIITQSDGSFFLSALTPGSYEVRVVYFSGTSGQNYQLQIIRPE